MRFSDNISKEDLKEKFATDGNEYFLSDGFIRENVPESDFDVQFDWENFFWEKNDVIYMGLIGPQEIEGRTFIGCCAGGDWEYPVFFILYLQDANWRVYIPKTGNVYNADIMKAIGNGKDTLNKCNADLNYMKKIIPDEFNNDEWDDFDTEDAELMLNILEIRKDILENVSISSTQDKY